MNISKVVDQILEGKEISSFLKNLDDTIIGKVIENCDCPSCEAHGSLIIDSVLNEDQGFYTVLAKCMHCNEPVELEFVLPEDDSEDSEQEVESVQISSQIFVPVTEGIMTGNYLKFNNGVKGFIVNNDKGENEIVFDEPEGDFKPLNTRVTYKIISFRNGLAKIVSMVNDNFNKAKAGTIYFVKKDLIQSQAKVSAPRANGSMAGVYA